MSTGWENVNTFSGRKSFRFSNQIYIFEDGEKADRPVDDTDARIHTHVHNFLGTNTYASAYTHTHIHAQPNKMFKTREKKEYCEKSTMKFIHHINKKWETEERKSWTQRKDWSELNGLFYARILWSYTFTKSCRRRRRHRQRRRHKRRRDKCWRECVFVLLKLCENF